MSQSQPQKEKAAQTKEESKAQTTAISKAEQKVQTPIQTPIKQIVLPIQQSKEQKATQKTKQKPKQPKKTVQKKKQTQQKSLPIKIILLKDNQPIHFQFPARIHNFNLTNTIFNFDDQKQYKLNQNFNDVKHLQVLRTFFEKHNYQPANIRIAKPLVSDKMKDNVDPITYEVLGKYQLDQNFQQASKLILLAEYIGISEFIDAMYAATGSSLMIFDNDEAIEQYKNKYGLNDLTVQQEDEIIKQFPAIFQKIHKDLTEGINKEIDLSPGLPQGMI